MKRPKRPNSTADRSRQVGKSPPPAQHLKLQLALDKNHQIKEKLEECVEELRSANGVVKKRIANMSTMQSAHAVLADSERVESKVRDCASDMQEVNRSLIQGIDGLQQNEIILTKSRIDLAGSETALATSQEETKEAIERALYDHMTGLPTRELFNDRLAHAISMAERHDWKLAVMFLDLDQFKSINDAHGHAAGDDVLKEVARRLALDSRDEDTMCRNGGDEFLVLLVNPRGRENIERIAGKVLKNAAFPIDSGDLQVNISLSIGIAVYPVDGTNGEQLIRNADAAMYRAKEFKSGYEFC